MPTTVGNTTQFDYTGAVQDFVVPLGVTSVFVKLWGGMGGGNSYGVGLGGYSEGTLAVTPGETLKVYVGRNGLNGYAPNTTPSPTGNPIATVAGGWNGGGAGHGIAYTQEGAASMTRFFGSGAGASDIRRGGTALSNRKIVAGGGAGGGIGFTEYGSIGGVPQWLTEHYNGGNGGGTSGTAGTGGSPGAGATQSSGSALGSGSDGNNYVEVGGGGGGGGYYGGLGGYGGGGGAGSGYVGGVTGGITTPGVSTAGIVAITVPNVAPNAPTLVSPIDSVILAVEVAQLFKWTFSDPNNGDTQGAAELRYREQGTSSWTVVSIAGPASQYTFAANVFVNGVSYEYQVRTQDAGGLWGPWCASGAYVVATTPDAPSITGPANGATISTATYDVAWSATNQEAVQVRTVADNAGDPDTDTIYTDTGTLVSSAGRTVKVAFATNGRYEHIQVRVRYNNLWGAWASVRVHVQYTLPATPTITVTPNAQGGYIEVEATHPAPTGDQPVLLCMEVWRSEAGAPAIRIAKDLPVSTVYRDYVVASGVEYSYFVRDIGVTGAAADSEVVT